MINSQMKRLSNAIKALQTTPKDCQGNEQSSTNCKSTRHGMFEGEIKTMFMICQQLQSLSAVGQGEAIPGHPECGRFKCTFERFPSEVQMPKIDADDNLKNYRNVDYNNFVCANFNQKIDRLDFIRENFVRTGQVCPE